ncbi:DUF2894 domain-containing protein [Luteimonas aestuarii]|uniref:DUF2894 domain-containing protein n=1 Tax=Luteimonas aestuarii TaxID=453837 RepID=A0A4V6PLP0_9GAMM|nr:DUF2894 domain-containing protein [Luteimonas aestuarii]TDK24959.1 DUF2894 domain-containing protein [Luteimonas aestuarii]
MSADARDLEARLAQWRDAGAERLAPLPFHLLRAMAERLPQHVGETRTLLAQRLDVLVATHAPAIDAAVAAARDMQATRDADALADDALASLLARLARDDPEANAAAEAEAGAATAPSNSPAAHALAEARRAWSGVRARSQLQQSLQQTAEDAGPLNSSRLVHRMLARMQALSPGYLQHFVSYMDALAWLDDHARNGAVQGDGAKPSRKRKSRKAG